MKTAVECLRMLGFLVALGFVVHSVFWLTQ
jgi:hypothetical protein